MFEEELLIKWLQVSRIIRNDSLLHDQFMNKITYNEALVLASIYRSETSFVLLSDILESTKMLKSQLNRTINSLLDKKLIFRRVNSSDKRKQEVKITEDGQKLLMEIKDAMIKIVRRFINVIGLEDSKEFDELLTKIIAKQDEIFSK